MGQGCLEPGESMLCIGNAAGDGLLPAVLGQRTLAVRTEAVDRGLDAVGVGVAAKPGVEGLDEAILMQVDGAGLFGPLGRG